MGVTYKKGKGNAGLDGIQFQLNVLTVFLLNALHTLKHWRISTEDEEAGKYDDVVLDLPDKTVLLQAKFKENKKINRDQLFSCSSKNNDFSLPKYFFSYLEIKSELKEKTVIICSNTGINDEDLKDCVTYDTVSSNSLLHYEGATCKFFTFNENILEDLRTSAGVYFDKNLRDKGIDKAAITDDNLKHFLKNLQFCSNYPSGDHLEKVIEQLLSRLHKSSLYPEVTSQEIYKKVEDWFKQRKGEYLTETRAKAMFSEIRSGRYCEKLKNYNVSFRQNHTELTDPNRIFHVASEGGDLLQTLKVYSGLQTDNGKKLYVDPDEDIEVQRQIIDSFGLPRYVFLILAVTKITERSEIEEISDKLRDALEKCKHKKLILVGQNNHELNQLIGSNNIVNVNESVTFEDLSDESQKRLANEKNIIFQGEEISLKELLATQTAQDWARAVNSEILEQLVSKKKIIVGARPVDLDVHTSQYYITRTFSRKNNNEQIEETYSEKDVYEVKEDAILIADSAGTGKTTVLTKLAATIKEKYPHLWVIKIELSDYSSIFREWPSGDGRAISAIEVLNSKKLTEITNHLQKFVFSMRRKVVLMLDGFDEIGPEYTGLILSLLARCRQETNFAKLILTTRGHMVAELNTVLNVEPFVLQSLTKQNQVYFLTSYWAHALDIGSVNRRKCERYAEALLKRMSSYRYRENYITGIPLQLRMLADIFQERNILNESATWEGCKEYMNGDGVNPKLPQEMNIATLYDMFIEKKRDVYVCKYNPSGYSETNKALSTRFDQFLTDHRKLALKVILSEDECELFSGQGCEDIDKTVLKMGIVQILNGEVHFIHRTFAEYFVAESLVNELRLQLHNPSVKFQQFFIERILKFSRYGTMLIFLDNFLQKVVHSIPPNIFDSYRSQIHQREFSWDGSDTILKLSARGHVAILQLILKCVDFKVIKDKEFSIANLVFQFSKNKNVFQSLSRRIGINVKNKNYNMLRTIQIMVQNGGINIKDEMGLTPLHCAVSIGYFKMMRFLVEQGAKIDSVDDEGNTALHIAARGGFLNIVEYLVQTGCNVNIKNKKGRTALYFGAAEHLLDTVQFLMERTDIVNTQEDAGHTALQFATGWGQLDNVKHLLESDCDINIKNNEGYTVLHVAGAEYLSLGIGKYLPSSVSETITVVVDNYYNYPFFYDYQFDIAKHLIEAGTDINLQDNYGYTPLHLFCLEGQLDIVKYILKRGGDINIRSNNGCTALAYIVFKVSHAAIVDLLVECGVNPNIEERWQHCINDCPKTLFIGAHRTFSRRGQILDLICAW